MGKKVIIREEDIDLDADKQQTSEKSVVPKPLTPYKRTKEAVRELENIFQTKGAKE